MRLEPPTMKESKVYLGLKAERPWRGGWFFAAGEAGCRADTTSKTTSKLAPVTLMRVFSISERWFVSRYSATKALGVLMVIRFSRRVRPVVLASQVLKLGLLTWSSSSPKATSQISRADLIKA